jgi:carbamoyl-phosphate synthase large subunit
LKILITGIGGDIGQAVAQIIRKKFPDTYIVGCDIYSKHAGSLFVDKFLVAPRADDVNYIDWIQNALINESIDFCIPTPEAELGFFQKTNIQSIGSVPLLMPNLKIIEIGLDKFATVEYLKSIGIKTPWTILSDTNIGELNFPCIFKHRKGAGSKVNFICNNKDEATFYTNEYPNGIFQELLVPADQEVTVAVFRDKNQNTKILQLQRELVGGLTGWAKVIFDADVEEQCQRIAEAVNLRGSINIQLRITDTGARIFEINPRFSSTILMRDLMGFCDVVWSIQDHLNLDKEYFQPEVGTEVVRVQSAKVIVK